jgi:hypothetical protein
MGSGAETGGRSLMEPEAARFNISGIPGSCHRICGSIAYYETPGRITRGECVSGIWASLFAGKRHCRGEWRGLLVLWRRKCGRR